MTVTIKNRETGTMLWTGEYETIAQAIADYRSDLGAEAHDYAAVDPNWADRLEIETD